MTAAIGEAMELALGLLRVPSRRLSLRERPLPDDVGVLIRLACGSPMLLRETAAMLHEPEAVVLEAARFYLQQVLFVQHADAYRVMGLRPDAPQPLVREHYQRLQRWLHPDRRGEDWEALYATRVNWAWGHLRSAQARHTYDQMTGVGLQAGNPVAVYPMSLTAHRRPGAGAEGPQGSWRSRAWLAAAVGSCLLLLLLLVAIGEEVPPDGRSADQPMAAATVPATPAAALAVPDPGRDTVARLDLAQECFLQVATYLANPRAPLPPIWHDLQGILDAERQRTALYARATKGGRGRLQFDPPVWRLSEHEASASTHYRLLDRGGVAESGRLQLELVWRDRMWLVKRLQLEPQP